MPDCPWTLVHSIRVFEAADAHRSGVCHRQMIASGKFARGNVVSITIVLCGVGRPCNISLGNSMAIVRHHSQHNG